MRIYINAVCTSPTWSTGIGGYDPCRRTHPAVTPVATDVYAPTIYSLIVAIERRCDEQTVLALHNVSPEPVTITIPAAFGLHDLISDAAISRMVTLDPWQAAWLTSGV